MSVVNPSPGQERQNRKILEQLEEEKKRLRMQQVKNSTPAAAAAPASGLTSATPAPLMAGIIQSQVSMPETQHMSAAQRAALVHAHANSVGYFITQESAFGNLILPVLPRFDAKWQETRCHHGAIYTTLVLYTVWRVVLTGVHCTYTWIVASYLMYVYYIKKKKVTDPVEQRLSYRHWRWN